MYEIIDFNEETKNEKGYVKRRKIIFDFLTSSSKDKADISYRMNYIYNDELKEYLITQEKLKFPEKYFKPSKIWPRIVNNKGDFCSDNIMDVYLHKDSLIPRLTLDIFSTQSINKERLFNKISLDKIHLFLETGNVFSKQVVDEDIEEKSGVNYIVR